MDARSRATGIARAIVAEAQEAEVPFLAASIAFYAMIALVPLLVLLFVATTLVGGEEFAQQSIAVTEGILTPAGQELVAETVLGAGGRGGATGIGAIVLVWSALRLFRGLDTAFAMVYGADVNATFVERISTAVIGFLAVTLAVGGMLVLASILLLFPGPGVLGPSSPLAIFVMLLVVFLPLYYFVPGVEVTVSEALPGAGVAAVGWTVLHLVFGLYAANAAQYGVYGAAGGVFLLLTWLYVGAMMLIVGAIVNAVLARGTKPGNPPMPREVEAADTEFEWVEREDLVPLDLEGDRRWAGCPDCGSPIELSPDAAEIECPNCGTVSAIELRLVASNRAVDAE